MRSFLNGKGFFVLGFVIPLLALVAGCGSSNAPEQISVTTKFSGEQLTPATVQARQGDMVSLTIDSEQPGTFHLHGYDLEGAASAGEPAEIQFTANATGRFALTFHGAADSTGSGATEAMDHGPMESATPVNLGISAQVEDDGGTHISIETEGWRWAPEEVNLANTEGAGHAHIYADGVKVGRIYGAYHYLPALAPGNHEIRVNLNTNAHNDLMWEGKPVESVTTITVPEPGSGNHPPADLGPESVTSDTPMSLALMVFPDPLGGYNLQIIPQGFEFSPGAGLAHQPGRGYAELAIDGELVTRAYVPWLNLPGQGEGMHTFSVKLVNNEGSPYQYNGELVEASAQLHEELKADGEGSASGHHSMTSDGAGHHEGGTGAGSGASHPSHPESDSDAGGELEVGYLEVLPR